MVICIGFQLNRGRRWDKNIKNQKQSISFLWCAKTLTLLFPSSILYVSFIKELVKCSNGVAKMLHPKWVCDVVVFVTLVAVVVKISWRRCYAVNLAIRVRDGLVQMLQR